jgi:hypothetical protein
VGGVGAPHNRVLDPFRQKGGVRKIKAPGSTAYPEAKAKGDNSMPKESGGCPKALTASPRKTRAIW